MGRSRLQLVPDQAQGTGPALKRATEERSRELTMNNATSEKKELISENFVSETAERVDQLLLENQELRLLSARLDSERLQLHAQMVLLKRELEIFDRERQSLDRRLNEMSKDVPAAHQRVRDLMQHSSLLTELHRFVLRMHGTTDRVRIFEAIEGAVQKLAGTGELMVFEADRTENVLRLIHANSVDASRFKSLSFGKGVIGRVASTGEPFFEGRSRMNGLSVDEQELGIALPLKIDERVVGVVAVFAVDPTIVGTDAMQDELYEIFARHTSSALYCSAQRPGS